METEKIELKKKSETQVEDIRTVKLKRISTNSFIEASGFKGKSYSDAVTNFCVGLDTRTGMLKQILTDKEALDFEKEFNYTPGTLGKNSEFWKTFEVRVVGDEINLDLTNPIEKLNYKVLLSKSNLIANGLEDLKSKANAEWVLTSDEQEATKGNAARKFKVQAFAKFAGMSYAEMADYLISIGKKPYNTSTHIIEKLVGDEIEADPKKFLETVEDPYYKHKIFINNCVSAGVLRMSGPAVYFNQDRIGNSILDAIDFITNKENSEIFISIKSQIEKINKNK